MWENLKPKSVKVKKKLNNMDKVMDIVKLKDFNLLKKEVEESEQNKNLDNDNKL